MHVIQILRLQWFVAGPHSGFELRPRYCVNVLFLFHQWELSVQVLYIYLYLSCSQAVQTFYICAATLIYHDWFDTYVVYVVYRYSCLA